jgi:predicted nucleic acid-binding protein
LTMPKVVSNSSPIIHLNKMGYIHLLEDIYQKVHITDCVYEECTGGSFESEEILKEIEDIKKASFLEVNSIKNKHLFLAFKEFVDEGEASAIVLAIEKEAELLLLDDRDARNLADVYNLEYTGTIGVLLKSRELGFIDRSVPDILDHLKSTGFYLNEKVEQHILKKFRS